MDRRQDQRDPLGKLEPGPATQKTPRTTHTSDEILTDKDAIFTSEEAVEHDKQDIARFDNENIVRSWAEEDYKRDVPSTTDYH